MFGKCHYIGECKVSKNLSIGAQSIVPVQKLIFGRSVNFLLFYCYFLRQKIDRPTPKHRREFITWQIFKSSREKISEPGIEPPTSSFRLGMSTFKAHRTLRRFDSMVSLERLVGLHGFREEFPLHVRATSHTRLRACDH